MDEDNRMTINLEQEKTLVIRQYEDIKTTLKAHGIYVKLSKEELKLELVTKNDSILETFGSFNGLQCWFRGFLYYKGPCQPSNLGE